MAPHRVITKQECLGIIPRKSVLHITEWSLSSIITSWHTPAWAGHGILLTMACKARRDPSLPALWPHLCHTRTLCSSPTGLLWIHGTRQPLSYSQDSAGAIPLLGTCLVRACAHTHTCARAPFLWLTPRPESQFPRECSGAGCLGSPGFPVH